MSRRFFSIVMCVIMCLAIGTIGTALAEETVETVEVEEEESGIQIRVSSEDAERQFLNGLFGLPVTPVEELPRLRGTVSGDSLESGSPARVLYDALRGKVKQVAAGELTSTEFAFENLFSYTAEDLDMNGEALFELINGSYHIRDSAMAKVRDLMAGAPNRAYKAVLYDCPYEMFWMDKGEGKSVFSASTSYGGTISPVQTITVSMTIRIMVNDSYIGDSQYTINSDKIQSVHHAAENAINIVNQNSGLGNYEKLTAYKDTICRLTDYNNEAAAETWTGGYGDPWQLVWVFDENPETKVVCEGYSKAFYYLCDKSDWAGDAVKTICVSGDLWSRDDEDSGYESGPHMCNIVRLNDQYYMADVTNTDSGNPGLFLDGYDRYDETENRFYYESGHYYPSGATRELGYSFDNDSIALYQSGGWLNLATEAADPNTRDPYPNEYETANAVWGISETEVLPGEEFTVYVTYNGQETDEITLQMVQGSKIIQYTGEGNTISGEFRAVNSTEPITIQCIASTAGEETAETYDGPLTVNAGQAAPVPTITVTGGRTTTTNGAISFQIAAAAPDNGDYSDISYEITPVGDDENPIPAIGGVFTTGTTQTITMNQVRRTGFSITEDTSFQLQVRAFGPGYESETALSPRLYVTGTRDEDFTISGSYKTGNETAQMLVNMANSLTVTAPDGVDSIQVRRGDNWINYSIDLGNEIWFDGYSAETAEAPLVARYTTGTGEKRYSNVIFVDHVNTLTCPWITVDKTSAVAGEDLFIQAYMPGAGHIRVGCQKGIIINDYFTDIVESDTGVWGVYFDEPGEYELFVAGWSDERWNHPNPDARNWPDLGGAGGYAKVTVTVTAQEEQNTPSATVTIPDPLLEYSQITVQLPEFTAAMEYSITCRRQDTREEIYSNWGTEPFDVTLYGNQLEERVAYTLEIKVRRYGYASYSEYIDLMRWGPEMPENITPGEDVVISIPELEGADGYEISVQPPYGIAYVTNSPQAGTFVIPAMVFADGFSGTIVISVYQNTEYDGHIELFWNYYNYTVEAYTGADILTITAGTYQDGILPINLNVSDAEQLIVQETEHMNHWEGPVSYWTTICTADNPGTAVAARLLVGKEHQIRAAVKQNGVWSAWSPVIEVTTPIYGRCNESIEWTLSDDGKLTVTGTGEIPNPYSMLDSWGDYSEAFVEVEIGSGITGIDDYTFSGCQELTTVTIPTSMTSLGEGVFCDCTSLTSIVSSDPNSTTATHKRCYDNILKTFSLPGTVTKAGIGYGAFYNTPAFGQATPLNPDFVIPNDTGRIEENAFSGIAATHIRIAPYDLDSCIIGNYAFSNCKSLRYFQVNGMSDELDFRIADKAFDGCTNLTFIGEFNDYLRQYAEDHGFEYLENETIGGNG